MWRGALGVVRIGVGAAVFSCVLTGKAALLPAQGPSAAPAPSTSALQVIDQFVASLPRTVIPVVSPRVNSIQNTMPIPPSWTEYHNQEVGISFRYPPAYEESADKVDNIVGLDCSAKNTICLAYRKEGGSEDFYSVSTLLSLTVSRNVSPFSCLFPYHAFRSIGYHGSEAETLTSINGTLFRNSDCSGAAAGTGTACTRYDAFADDACYEVIPQISMSCGGVSGKDLEACRNEASAQEKDLDKTLTTFTFTKKMPAVDPRHPVPWEIIHTTPLHYTPYTLQHGQVGVSFEYPDDQNWRFVDTQYEHELSGQIPLGGAQINDHPFIAVSFDPRVAAFNLQQESSFIHFMLNDTLGQGYGLNGDPRLPDMPKGVWRVSGGAGVSGYFVMNYGAMGRVNGTLALSVSVCHTYTCTLSAPLEVLIEFLDVNNDIARRFLSSLRITMPGESHAITAGEKLNVP